MSWKPFRTEPVRIDGNPVSTRVVLSFENGTNHDAVNTLRNHALDDFKARIGEALKAMPVWRAWESSRDKLATATATLARLEAQEAEQGEEIAQLLSMDKYADDKLAHLVSRSVRLDAVRKAMGPLRAAAVAAHQKLERELRQVMTNVLAELDKELRERREAVVRDLAGLMSQQLDALLATDAHLQAIGGHATTAAIAAVLPPPPVVE
jgi:BMFP domain-containing protein YqiC